MRKNGECEIKRERAPNSEPFGLRDTTVNTSAPIAIMNGHVLYDTSLYEGQSWILDNRHIPSNFHRVQAMWDRDGSELQHRDGKIGTKLTAFVLDVARKIHEQDCDSSTNIALFGYPAKFLVASAFILSQSGGGSSSFILDGI